MMRSSGTLMPVMKPVADSASRPIAAACTLPIWFCTFFLLRITITHSCGVSFSTRVPAVPAKGITRPITSDSALARQATGSLFTLLTTVLSRLGRFALSVFTIAGFFGFGCKGAQCRVAGLC